MYARDPSKMASMFSQANNGRLKMIQVDFEELSPIKEAVKGRSRLYIMASDLSTYAQVKKTFVSYAYAASVTQIVPLHRSWLENR